VTCCPASEADIEVLLRMMRHLYEHDGVPFDEARSRRGTLELMESPEEGSVWLLTVEGAVAGYCVLTFGFSIEYHGRHGFIDELFVLEGYRGHGLGSLAIEQASAVCRSLGMRVILLEVAFENERAHALYARMGFREHGRRLMSRTIDDDDAQP
jgi:diamine N-acetyltransferase